jgi:ATP-dependent helicase/nuclease subunit B
MVPRARGASPLAGPSGPVSTAGIHHRSLTSLAADLARKPLAERGWAPLAQLAMEAITARVVHEVRRELQYFGPVAGMPGFPRALARTLGELRLARVTPETVGRAGEAGCDLAALLRAYEAELHRRGLVDLAGVLDLAAEEARSGSHRLLGLPVAFLDVPLDWPAQRELAEAVAQRAPAVLRALLSMDSEDEDAEDLDRGEPLQSLDHLRSNLFKTFPGKFAGPDGRFGFFSAPGEGLEATEIARRILRFARQGIAFDRIAILLRSPERYQPAVEEALRRAGIEGYFSRGARRPDPAGRAFLALLACAAESVSASRFAEYLSLAQVPPADASGAPRPAPERWVSAEEELLARSAVEPEAEEPAQDPVEESSPDAPVAAGSLRAPASWERLLVDAAVVGGYDRWERRLAGLEHELELKMAALANDPERRERVERQLGRLRHLKHFALPLVSALHELPSEASWAEWIEKLAALARLALRNPDGVLSVLAELEPMAGVGPASLEEVAEVLSEKLRFLQREPAERPWGRVFVGSIDEARGREFDVVFLPGLAEGLFPQRAAEDPLFLDELRAAVDAALPSRGDRAREERRRLHVAVGAAREHLIASYPRMDVAAARPRVPSFYALELPRAIESELPDLRKFENRAREAAPARLNRPGPRVLADAIDDAEYDLVAIEDAREGQGRARYLVEVNPALARSLRGRWSRWKRKWSAADGLVTSEPRALQALSLHRLAERAWSPSSLQLFAVCPYRFFLHGIHRLEPREEPVALEQLDALTRGAVFHAVQFALLNDLKSAGLLPVSEATLAAACELGDAALGRVAAEYKERLVPAVERVWYAEIEDLRTDLRGWLQHAARNDFDWLPVHFELAFGLAPEEGRDPASSAAEVVLREGVRLRGSIDLVERHVKTGAIRVTDHKTGKLPDSVPAITGGGKVLQPLLYGLAAEKLLGTPVESGRLFYSTQRGGYKFIPIALNEKARAILARLLADIDASIAGGFLPPYPEQDACGYCDYRPVCGPYEPLRAAKKDRADERLEPLVEIRGTM